MKTYIFLSRAGVSAASLSQNPKGYTTLLSSDFFIDMLTVLKFISSAPTPRNKMGFSHPKRCVAQKNICQILVIIVSYINCAALHKTFRKFWDCNYLSKLFVSLFTFSAQAIFPAQNLDRNCRYLPVDASRKKKVQGI